MEATRDEQQESDIENKLIQLQQQKEQVEHEFGLKRAKFKSMYLECESLLKAEKERREAAESSFDNIRSELATLKSDTEGIQAAAKFSEQARHEEIAAMKVKHHEEMASMEHIWKEAIREARATTAKQFEDEFKRLSSANQKLEQQLKGVKIDEKSEGLLSIVSQAIRRAPVAQQQPPSASPVTQADSKEVGLGNTMTQAQENVEAWRSIVLPLEEEIASLKSRLKEANSRVKQYEAKSAKHSSDAGSVSSDRPADQVKELQGYLDAERSSRTDLEMYVAVLNTQKGVLQEDADKLRQELHNVCRLLEQEKMDHRELKETWRKANEEFLEQHTILSWEIEKMRQLLTPAQLEKLSKQFRQKQSRPAKTIKTVAEEPYAVGNAEEPYAVGNANENLISFEDSPTKTQRAITPSDVHISEKMLSSKSSSIESSDDSTDDTDSPSKVPLHPIGSLEEGEELSEDLDGEAKDHGMTKAMSTSDINKAENELKGINVPSPTCKSSSQGDVSSITSASGEDAWAVISSPTVADLERKMHLNETGWSTMKEPSMANQTCMMCQNYEKQLQRLQKEFVVLKDRKDSLMSFAKKEKFELRAEREKVEKLERSICIASEDAQKQIQIHSEIENEQMEHLEELQKEFLTLQQDVTLQVRHLSEERDRMMAELETLRDENASLSTIQETLRLDQQHNMASKDGPTMLHDKLEQMKVNSSTNEEQLRSEIMFLKDRVMAEQFDKENTERILQQDVDQARQEIVRLKEQISVCDTGKRKDAKEDAEET